MPEGRSAWRVDDPEWMKERKRHWRVVNAILKRSGSGGEPGNFIAARRFNPDDALRGHGIDANVLFETWLNADRSAENWQRIRDRVDNGTNQSSWHSSQARFLESFKKYPVESALYGVSGGRKVVALDADDGSYLWHTDLPTDADAGIAKCGDRLYVPP